MSYSSLVKKWFGIQSSFDNIPISQYHVRCSEETIKLLANYHAMSIDNPQFIKQYKPLLTMYLTLCKRANVQPITLNKEFTQNVR